MFFTLCPFALLSQISQGWYMFFIALEHSSTGLSWFTCILTSHKVGFYKSRIFLRFILLNLSWKCSTKQLTQTLSVFVRTKIFEPVIYFHNKQLNISAICSVSFTFQSLLAVMWDLKLHWVIWNLSSGGQWLRRYIKQ